MIGGSSSAKDQRVTATGNAKGVGAKGRLTEAGSFQVGDKGTLSTGNTAQTITSAGPVTVTDSGAIKGAFDLAQNAQAGLLSSLGAKPLASGSVFGSIMGDSAGDTVGKVADAQGKLPSWGWWALGGLGAVVLVGVVLNLLRSKK